MRVVVTGTDEDGSHVAETLVVEGPTDGERLEPVFEGRLSISSGGGRTGQFMDIAPGAGEAAWRVFDFSPGLVYENHHTDSVDLDVVVAGSIELGLDQEVVVLEAGDACLIRGDSHRWEAGPKGCRMLIALLGPANAKPA